MNQANSCVSITNFLKSFLVEFYIYSKYRTHIFLNRCSNKTCYSESTLVKKHKILLHSNILWEVYSVTKNQKKYIKLPLSMEAIVRSWNKNNELKLFDNKKNGTVWDEMDFRDRFVSVEFFLGWKGFLLHTKIERHVWKTKKKKK